MIEGQELLDAPDALDDIAREAASEQAAATAGEAQAQADANGITAAQSWAQIPMLLGGLLAVALPEVADAYTEPACLAWGEAMNKLAQKHGWGEGAGRYAPEIAVVIASAPLVLPVYFAVKARREAAAEGAASPHAQTMAEVTASAPGATAGAAPVVMTEGD